MIGYLAAVLNNVGLLVVGVGAGASYSTLQPIALPVLLGGVATFALAQLLTPRADRHQQRMATNVVQVYRAALDVTDPAARMNIDLMVSRAGYVVEPADTLEDWKP